MNVFTRKCMYGLLGAGLTLSSVGTTAAPGTLASKPLWMGSSVKHNLILALDDSGSMAWEMIFPADQGHLNLSSSTGSFFFSTGTTGFDYNNSGYDYNYISPWHESGSYKAVPPIDAYAFSRSPDYNGMYYNPDEEYEPWPIYGNYVPSKGPFDGQTLENHFPDADISDASGVYLGPFSSSKRKLFETLSDSFTTYNRMVYDDAGNTRTSDGSVTYNWQVATYYLKKTTGSYTYVAGGSGGSGEVAHNENSVVVEAESGSVNNNMTKYTADCDGCSGGYIGTPNNGDVSYDSPPSQNAGIVSFTSPGETVEIWFRVRVSDGDSDSFWIRFDGKGDADFTAAGGDDEVWVNNFEKFWQGMSTYNTWIWKKWGTMTNLTKDDSYTIRMKRREDGAQADQIFITTTDATPSGIMALSAPPPPPVVTGETRSCNPASIVEAGINGLTYHDDFRLRNGTFSAITDGSETKALGGIGPDGACLVKYVIPKTGTDFDNGITTRPLAEEQQNFANWFMYYRRRFYAMQGGVGSALNGISNVRAGMFTINERNDVTMWDMDEDTGKGSFLSKHYDDYSASGGTNLRASLNFAGSQFMRTGAGAPIISECQKNYTLLFSDGFNTTLSYSGVGNEDGSAGTPFQDGYSGTLGDIAYKYYNTRLRTDTGFPAGQVKVSEECEAGTANAWDDCKTDLHMNTYTVGFGLEGTVYDKYVDSSHTGASDPKFRTRQDAHVYKDSLSWPSVSAAADERQVDDMYHAAVNGFGETYSANSPGELKSKLSDALEDILEDAGSGSGVTFNSSSLSASGDIGVYFTSFNASTWQGDLIARRIYTPADQALNSSHVAGTLSSNFPWRIAASGDVNETKGAAGILDARVISSDPRVIYTFNGTEGVGFHWDGAGGRNTLTEAQKADLQAGETEAAGRARTAWFKGDRTHEASSTTYNLRNRASRLGDIVNSTPVFVGAPASNWPETSDFGTGNDSHKKFKTDNEERTPTVWVAANDGMLHGFDARMDRAAGGGKEVLAYIPGSLYNSSTTAGLSYLTSPSYVHQYYNDLSPVVQDVRINPGYAGAVTSWRTVLIGGLGAGGKGIYALDITDPTDFTDVDSSDANPAKVVLWEFDSSDDSDMGYLVTPPSIAKMNDGSWAVVFGNGYNSTSGVTALFIVRIEEGADGTWGAGDYTKIVIPASASVDGLSGISLADLNGDRKVDRAYGGDLHGNLWAFDLSSGTATNWGVAYTTGGGATKVPLFKAINEDGQPQPITAAPNLAYNTETTKVGNEPNVLVGFGTGQYLVAGDNTNTEVQSFYIVWDRGSTGATNSGLVRSNLVERELVFEEAAYEDHGKITISSDTDDAIDWTAATDLKYGWYIDFIVGTNKLGERLITKPLFRSSKNEGIVAVFITRIPNTAASCLGGGKSSLYAMPILTGLAPTEPIIDLDGDGEIDVTSEFGVGREFGEMYDDPNMLSDVIYAACSTGENCVDTTVTDFGDVSVRTGRLGWHELINE